jgi:hypothetical protein
MPGRGRCASLFLDRRGRSIGTSQSKHAAPTDAPKGRRTEDPEPRRPPRLAARAAAAEIDCAVWLCSSIDALSSRWRRPSAAALSRPRLDPGLGLAPLTSATATVNER